MKFELPIGTEKVLAGYTGKTARIYREQFQRDLMLDLGEAAARCVGTYQNDINGGFLNLDDPTQLAEVTIRAVGAEMLEHFIWAAVYSCNDGVPLYETWLDSIDDYPDLMMSAYLCFEYMIGNVSLTHPEESEESEETAGDEGKKKSPTQKSSA